MTEERLSFSTDQVVICLGVVKNNADPAQHGRCQIFVPSIDNKDYQVDDLPWAQYVSPFGGTTANFQVGREKHSIPGVHSYGWWAIPKNGAQVLCGFLEGDPNVRFYMGSFFLPELNRTLPSAIDPLKTEIDESGQYPQEQIPYMLANLGEASLGPDDVHYKVRGGYDRSISHPSNKNKDKPRDNGYYDKPLEAAKADSQMHVFATPGKHFMLFSDIDEYCRIRIKTTEGTQIIFDDTNERIYISTAKGRNWVELDEGNGKMYFYSTSKINFHSENDFNIYSSSNVNIVAKNRINIESQERAVKIQAKMNVELLSREANLKLSASRDIHVKNFNGPRAEAVEEKQVCNLPPWSGQPLSLVRDYAEEAGSETSNIYLNAAQEIHERADDGSIMITAKRNVHTKAIEGDVGVQGMNVAVKAGKKIGVVSTDDIVVSSGQNLELNANGVAAMIAPATTVTGIATLGLGGSEIVASTSIGLGGVTGSKSNVNVNTTVADSAEEVTSQDVQPLMVVPQHDSTAGWVRDEDEGQCKTPRNPKYQG